MQQSKLESIIEQFLNVGSGFALAWCVWQFALVSAIDQGYLSYSDTTAITSVFTLISVARGYFWRRIFNRRIPHEIAKFILLFKKRS